MQPTSTNLKHLLPYGSIGAIAKKLGLSSPAVSQALKTAKPSSRVVQEALRIAKESGALDAAHTLASLKTV